MTRREQRLDLVQAVYCGKEGRESVSPKYTQPSDKEGNSFVETFMEKVLQEEKKDKVQFWTGDVSDENMLF